MIANDPHYHPSDAYSLAACRATDGDRLLENYEHALASDVSVSYRAGALEILTSVAIARVRLLERQLAKQERKAASSLYGGRRHIQVLPGGKDGAA